MKNKTYIYFEEKSKELYGKRFGDPTPEVLMFSQNLIKQLEKTRIEAIEYVKIRKTIPHKERGNQTIDFLSKVNFFLGSVTDLELNNILRNPKDDGSLKTQLTNFFEKTMPDVSEKNLKMYVKGIRNLYKRNLKREFELIRRKI